MQSRITALEAIVGPDCGILKDSNETNFEKYAQRWTNIGSETPAAIVLPRTEEDIQKVVRWAIKSSIPFVAKSGGCSEWSTIGDNGFFVDLTHYSAIKSMPGLVQQLSGAMSYKKKRLCVLQRRNCSQVRGTFGDFRSFWGTKKA